MKNNKQPNFFIVGAPKCGTTSLYQWLREHPDVFMPEEKEPKWFCHDLRKRSKENDSDHLFPAWSQEEYLELFKNAKDSQAIGEASTYYLYSEVAAEKIKEFNPDAKIIIMLRNPVELIVSSYNYAVRKGQETATSLEEALALEKKRKDNPPEGKFPDSYLYTKKAQFDKHIPRFQKHLPSGQIKYVLLDDLKSNPEQTYQEVLAFLGVENTNFSPTMEKENTGKTPRLQWLNQAIKHPSSPIRKVAELIPKSWAKSIRDLLNTFLLTDKKYVSEEVRKKLKQKLKPTVEKASELIGRDLVSMWEYDDIG